MIGKGGCGLGGCQKLALCPVHRLPCPPVLPLCQDCLAATFRGA